MAALVSSSPPRLPPLSSPRSPPMFSMSVRAPERPLPSIPEPPLPHPQPASHKYTRAARMTPAPSVDTITATRHTRVSSNPSALPVQRVLSSFMPRSFTSSLVPTLQHPIVLAAIIAHLDWPDVYTLLAASRSTRELFRHFSLRDVFLARFVPGYAFCLTQRDMQRYQDIPVSIHDLDLLLISQRANLHRYPMHALRTLTALYPTFEDDQLTSKLVEMTRAHSRFVLLFQAMVHSSSSPMPYEAEEVKIKSRFQQIPTLRELTFPAPLAYSQSHPPKQYHPTKASSEGGSRPSSSSSSSSSRASGTGSGKAARHSPLSRGSKRRSASDIIPPVPPLPPIPPHLIDPDAPTIPLPDRQLRPSASSLSSMMPMTNSPNNVSSTDRSNSTALMRKGRRMSIFGKNSYRFDPPPPEEPRALRMYSSWRRKPSTSSSHARASTYGDGTVDDGFMGVAGYEYEDGGSLRRPKRKFASEAASSDSSIATSVGAGGGGGGGRDSPYHYSVSSSSGTSPLSSGHNSMTSGGIPRLGHSAAAQVSAAVHASSIHDLTFATQRTRAPILRVFVPSAEEVLEKCEKQLMEAGLWKHLSIGDIVCNLGYVPPSTGEDGSEESGEISGTSAQITIKSKSSRMFGQPPPLPAQPLGGMTTRKWLLFDGHYLVPYTPPDLLPLNEPLNLPTPFYYSHIMPPAASPTYIIERMPAVDLSPSPSSPSSPSPSPTQLTLVHTQQKIASPHSPKGYALVRKWAWVARVTRLRAADDSENEMGDGWFGEWTLEYEGTKEGKQVLIDALQGRLLGRRVWEVVREKSGAGRLWLKLSTVTA